MKKKCTVITMFTLVCLMFTACIIEHDLPDLADDGGRPEGLWGNWFPVENGEALEFRPHSGRLIGESREGHSGGLIRLNIDMYEGRITELSFANTTGQGAMYLNRVRFQLFPRVIETNSFAVSAVAGATNTARGTQAAARNAMMNSPDIADEFVNF